MPVTEHGEAARTLAKVAIVLPAQLFYLAEPTALAFPALLGLVTFLTAQDPTAGRIQLLILLLGNLVGSVAAAAAAVVFEIGPPLPALTLMALLGSLGFARWMITAGRRPGGAVALTGLVTFLMLFGLAASSVPFDVPVLDRVADIGLLSLYTIGATTLLLPPRSPQLPSWPSPADRRTVKLFQLNQQPRSKDSSSHNDLQLTRTHALLRTHREVINGNGK